MTANQIAYWNNQETIRANQAREKETHRANVAKEAETNRSNVAQETETNRSNLAREGETHRHNQWDEGIRLANAITGGIRDVSSAYQSATKGTKDAAQLWAIFG